MKKLVSLLMAMVLLSVCLSGCGGSNEKGSDNIVSTQSNEVKEKEDLVLHAGIMLGDTFDEVKKKESETTDELIIDYKYDLEYKGEIAGINNTNIQYCNGLYDVDKSKITIVRYIWSIDIVRHTFGVQIKDFINENTIQSLYKIMKDKYGEEIGKDNYVYTLIGTDAETYNERNYVSHVWAYEGKTHNVKITMYYNNKNDNCTIEYYYYTNEELEQKINENGGITQDKKNDL